MKKTKAALFALLLLAGIFALFGCAEGENPEASQIEIIPSAPIKYSEGFAKKEAGELADRLNLIVKEVYGSEIPGGNDLIKKSMEKVITSFEKRSIKEESARAAAERIKSAEGLFRSLVISSKEGAALPFDGLIGLFGDLSSLFGTDTASRLIYDFTLILFEYQEDKYTQLYMKNPEFSYLFDYAVRRQYYQKELNKIGEENFSLLLRTAVSASELLSRSEESVGDFVSALSPAETALFFNTEGRLLSRMTLTEENILFIIEFLGENSFGEFFKAILFTNDTGRYSENALPLFNSIAKALAMADKDAAAALMANDVSGFLFELTSKWDEGDWEAFEAFFLGENEEEYIEYFKKTNLLKEYTSFKAESTEAVTLEDLRMADSEAFSELITVYIKTHAPAFAFTVFKL